MSRSFQKQIKCTGPVELSADVARSIANLRLLSGSKGKWSSTAKENKFKGMAENIEIVQPLIIPGYKIRG
ncbi:hypothetical protein DBR43_05145 [Pedobacter sp. KBW06]|uniref:hypothetical protein n=1 Tax=Pedobacter sp. KBW06 TaxID=2153359 RepID=UPI000F5AE011|nr:hypothetical protein [Pedobacter sp. KBW06]RQO74772.1 hypothetical protein DBR43_05145 [Pedobacter sp. KBW06]